MKVLFSLLLITIALNAKVVYKTDSFKVEQLADNLGVVWGVDFLDKDRVIFTEKRGRVGILDLKNKKVTYLKGVPKTLFAQGQGGLMDVAVKDDHVYFTHLKRVDGESVTVLSKAKLNGERVVSWEEVFVTKSGSDTGRHFGSRVAFDKNYLYFSIGDRGVRPNGQDLNTHAGTIIRLNLDGSIPKDNPFVGKKGLDEIYSYGHRNPQGLFYDVKRKKLFSNEHGPRGGDEINVIEKDKNYGWPEISYGKEYWNPFYVGDFKRKGMEQPLHQFTPSIAPSSLLIYYGDKFQKWQGKFFSGALALTHINIIEFDKNYRVVNEERLLEGFGERVRDVVEGKEGYIYFSTDSGKIFRLVD